ncbi:hypothetical protein TWF694_006414 [Orbilia ellipsospora]|uniref:Uncharacterized protein n=1 Tax=Orbilia ellipsospora TaxID=2528407 RepID=A0AAV9XKZ6_9PEZI
MRKMDIGEITTVMAHPGFNVHSVSYANVRFMAWDTDIDKNTIQRGRDFYQDIRGVIFVVDSHDLQDWVKARDELHR